VVLVFASCHRGVTTSSVEDLELFLGASFDRGDHYKQGLARGRGPRTEVREPGEGMAWGVVEKRLPEKKGTGTRWGQASPHPQPTPLGFFH
jgi:hypothetical protein